MGLVTGQKTAQQIDSMRECGRILATIYQQLRQQVTAGVSEMEINDWVKKWIREMGAKPSYETEEIGFPGVICISVNDALVHSPPSNYVLEKGDVVGFDLVINYQGVHTDSAFTMVVDEVPTGATKHLLKVTEQSLYSGIDAISGAGTRIGDISSAIEDVLNRGKLGVVKELVGHGVGLKMHLPPNVPNFGIRGTGPVLNPGDTIAIEPMASLGGGEVVTDKEDGWTISMKDGSLAAHFEHTVLITEDGAEILTIL